MNTSKYIKKTIYNLHLYIGLAAGLIIFLVCLTGALYTFKTQIENAINFKKVYVKAQDQEFISLDTIAFQLHQQGLQINSLTNHNAKNRSIEVYYNSIDHTHTGMYYINPYTGEILGNRNTSLGFIFSTLLSLHKSLLMGEIGRTIVGISILIFVFMLLSGLILWVPSKWSAMKRALIIKKKEGNSRFILDLHNVLGFYFIPILLFISILGLYVSFPWVKSSLIVAFGGTPVISQSSSEELTKVNSELSASFTASLAKIIAQKKDDKKETIQPMIPLDSITLISNQILPYRAITSIQLPNKDNAWIRVSKINRENPFKALLTDLIELNKKGEVMNIELFKDKSISDQFIALSLPMHTGEILGWPSLILYFIACLVAMSLPVTGTILWYKRLKKQKKIPLSSSGETKTKSQQKIIKEDWLVAYASKSGNSKLVAKKATQHLLNQGIQVKCKNISQVNYNSIPQLKNLFMVISTDGEGVPPQSANAFFNYLNHEAPPLTQLSYSICALGDSSYEYFCEAGKKLDIKLSELGATPLLSRVDCDADFAQAATKWIKDIVSISLQCKTTKHAFSCGVESLTNAVQTQEATIKHIEILSKGAKDKPCYHLTLQTQHALAEIKPGDSIEIKPENPHNLVKELCKKIGVQEDSTSYQYLKKEVELTSISAKTVEQYLLLTGNKDLKSNIQDKSQMQKYISKAHFLDLINDFPAVIDFHQIKELLPPIKSRYYSIASCTAANSYELHLTVKAIRYLFNHQIHEGAASVRITEKLKEGNLLNFKHRPNLEFRLPQDPCHLIMIGVGTGIAPFRAFLQNYQHRNIKNKCWLIWGEKNYDCDYLYKEELQSLEKNNILSRLNTVFSRDGDERIHVQDILPTYENDIINWLSQGAHIYVCGSIKMATDVKNTLAKILIESTSNMSQLIKEKRYHEDAY